MALDQRGDISVVEIIIYIPVLIVGVILVMRHGFSKKAGWVFLVILSLMRLVGGVTHVLSETTDPDSTDLIIAYSVCEMSGTSPLLLASLGFLGAVGTGVLDEHILMTTGTRLMGLCGTVAVILGIVGGVKSGEATTQSTINSGEELRRIGACLYIIIFLFLSIFTFTLWSESGRLAAWKRRLLTGVSCALPFIAVRVLYTILSAFAPASESIAPDGQVTYVTDATGLGLFSSTYGSWELFLIMSVAVEFVAVVIFGVTGLGMPKEVSDEKVYGA